MPRLHRAKSPETQQRSRPNAIGSRSAQIFFGTLCWIADATRPRESCLLLAKLFGGGAMVKAERLRKHADRILRLASKARERGHVQCAERLRTWASEISNEAAALEAWHPHPPKGPQRRVLQQVTTDLSQILVGAGHSVARRATCVQFTTVVEPGDRSEIPVPKSGLFASIRRVPPP